MTGRAVLKRCLYTDTPSDTHPDTASVTSKVWNSGLLKVVQKKSRFSIKALNFAIIVAWDPWSGT